MTNVQTDEDFLNEFFTDFEIHEAEEIDKNLAEQNNDYENFEVEVPDDIDLENIQSILDGVEPLMVEIPEIPVTVIEDKDIPLVVEHGQSSSTVKDISFVCSRCSKKYKKELFYIKHISLCQLQREAFYAADQGAQSIESLVRHPTSVSVSKQKKKVITDTLKSTDEELLESSCEILKLALNQTIDDPNHSRKLKHLTPGNKIKIVAERIKEELLSNESFLSSESQKIISFFANIIKATDLSKSGSRDLMWKQIRENIQEGSLFETWNDVVQDDEKTSQYASSIAGLSFQVSMNVCLAVIKHENEVMQAEKMLETDADISIKKDEQNIIYYVAGYIVFSLLKKYNGIKRNHPHNSCAETAIEFLTSLTLKSATDISCHSFLEFAKEWTQKLDRGGLVKVTDEMYLFTRSVENTVRKILNINLLRQYKGEDLRDILLEKASDNKIVNRYWESLARYLPSDKLSKHLKKQILLKWVDLRAHSFVKAYVQILRRKLAEESAAKLKKAKLSQASEKGLRKDLQAKE